MKLYTLDNEDAATVTDWLRCYPEIATMPHALVEKHFGRDFANQLKCYRVVIHRTLQDNQNSELVAQCDGKALS